MRKWKREASRKKHFAILFKNSKTQGRFRYEFQKNNVFKSQLSRELTIWASKLFLWTRALVLFLWQFLTACNSRPLATLNAMYFCIKLFIWMLLQYWWRTSINAFSQLTASDLIIVYELHNLGRELNYYSLFLIEH